jgi:pyruvate carboxylase
VFAKILVANRGEIAIRAFRAAYELGVRTVAVFPYEDRNSEHRLKADEAYEIGERGHPVRAYLDPDAIVATAVRAEADAVYPGYGFLSENPALAKACADAGLTFVGPSVDVLRLTGNKARAIAAARAAGVPVLESLEPSGTSTRSPPAPNSCPTRCSSRPLPAAVAEACAAWTTPRACATTSRPRCERPTPRSATAPCSSSRRWSSRATSRCRSSRTPPGT